MVDWLTSPDVALLVCDVSVEAAVLARLCGVAPAVVRQNGHRGDDAHTLAHRIAVGILAPFRRELEAPGTPAWVEAKTFYGGFISANDGHRPSRGDARMALGLDARPVLLVLLGGGGHSFDPRSLADARQELDGWQIVLVGPVPRSPRGAADRVDGWVDDLTDHLAAADVVMGSAGSNVVADVATAGRPLICVPEERPFDEQVQRAEQLAALGAAVTIARWPQRGEWRPMVMSALDLGPSRLAELAAGATPEPTARWITELAATARAT